MPAAVTSLAFSAALRCAIYARTSSAQGSDQPWNSIAAQSEAGRAYIASQASHQWVAVEPPYTDEGTSGASLERTGLKQLLADIEAGKIDRVVVYKLDRLTRRLADFSRLMDFFERHQVSLVSVTESLRTDDSMGRLVVNILISFAEFERALTGERVRDQRQAARRKGWWGGCVPPLGYRKQGPHLMIEPDEAVLVRTIFERFLELQSVTTLTRELMDQGVTTKRWVARNGHLRGGKVIDKAYVYKALNNRLLLGEVESDGQWRPASHPPIIERVLWDRVHALLDARRRPPNSSYRGGSDYLLRGRIVGEDGRAYTPWTASARRPRFHRYYVPQREIALGAGASGLPRLRAHDVEKAVIDQAYVFLKNIDQVWSQLPPSITAEPDYDQHRLKRAVMAVVAIWYELPLLIRDQMILLIVDKVIVHAGGLSLRWNLGGLKEVGRLYWENGRTVNSVADRLAPPDTSRLGYAFYRRLAELVADDAEARRQVEVERKARKSRRKS